jgi:hypothetical protein
MGLFGEIAKNLTSAPRRDDPAVREYIEAADEYAQGDGSGARLRDAARHLTPAVVNQLDRELRR